MKKWLTVLIFPLVIAGCGGGGGGSSDEKPAAELTGQLQGGSIQGVEWRTPTRSGVTDASGRFAYLPGESVTFSLGAIEFGTVPGSSDITLFTLAGLTPPTTERALRRELDRAMRTGTPFTHAINLDLLLLALDADDNPDNGIDVRNRANALSGVALDLDQGIGAFGTQLYTRVPGLTQSVPIFKPVAHLYASLGLRVPVHAQTRVTTEFPGSVSPGVRTVSYLPNGLIASEDDDRDGDGVVDSHSDYAFDSYGRLAASNDAYDNDLDHVVEQRYSQNYRYDAHGKITGFVQSVEGPFIGASQTVTLIEHVTDDFGRTMREVVELDTDSDGAADECQVITGEYDAARGSSVFTTSRDVGADGVVDEIIRSTEILDSKRRALSRVLEWDLDANGVVDSRDTSTYSYDDTARTMHLVSESDWNADGIADWRSVTDWQLDRAGNVTAQKTAIEPLADGDVWQAQTDLREFDADRRVTNETRDVDLNGDGVQDQRQVYATTYDDLGNETLATNDFDDHVDGLIDAHFDVGSEYGPDGQLLGSAEHYDFDGDGLTELRVGHTVENTPVDDGVLLLTNWYVRTRFSGFQ